MKGMKGVFCGLLFVAVFFAVAQQASGFVVADYTTLNAEDAGSGDQYGFSVDTDGTWLAVGAKSATVAGLKSGAVYIYRKNKASGEWQFAQKLVPANEDGVSPAEFGESVAVSDNRLLVGARSMLNSNEVASGTAFLYQYKGKHRGWVFETEVEPSDGNAGDEFGRAVALGPNRLFVGARFAQNSLGESSGAVYVYKKHGRNWMQETKLTDPNGGDKDQFGRAISFDTKRHRYLAVGSRKAADGVGDQGKVIVFEVRGKKWNWLEEIEAYDGTDTDYFGQSVALSGDLLVVGSRDTFNDAGENAGAAYIYRLSRKEKEWQFEQKLVPSDGHAKGQYGFAVDFDSKTGKNLAVSARRMNSAIGKKTGQVYLYSYDDKALQWDLDDVIATDDLQPEDEFGQSIAIDPDGGNWLIVGADQTSVEDLEKAGTVYVLPSESPVECTK